MQPPSRLPLQLLATPCQAEGGISVGFLLPTPIRIPHDPQTPESLFFWPRNNHPVRSVRETEKRDRAKEEKGEEEGEGRGAEGRGGERRGKNE